MTRGQEVRTRVAALLAALWAALEPVVYYVSLLLTSRPAPRLRTHHGAVSTAHRLV